MSPAESARQNAAATVRAQMGLPASPLSWTYEQRIEYNQRLADYLLAYPIGVDAETLRQASAVANKSYEALDDSSFSWVQFGDELAPSAGRVLSAVSNRLLVILTLGAVVFFAVLAEKHRPKK